VATALLTEAELERDQRLVQRFHAGDSSAFGELYTLHHPRLLRFCSRKVHDAHLAEELAQETFLKAYGALATFQGGRAFYPWLTVIASRLVIDHHRRSGRVQPRAEIDLGVVDDAQDDLIREVEREQIRTALGRVRGRHQEVLRLRDWEDLSYEAIAQRMGTSPTIVQALLHRARAAVRREYLALAESAALLPGVSVIARLLQRTRLRAARLAAWLPDPAALGTPLAAAAIAAGMALSPATSLSSPAAPTDFGSHPADAFGAPPAPRLVQPRDTAAEAAPTTVEPPAIRHEPAAEIMLGTEGAQRARAQSQTMPAQIDTGPAFVGLDPPAALRDTIAATNRLLGDR
jgi:RNA polymerase sigma-70 factor (ECF subfamily)